jgi:hypothetical protein
MVPAGIHHIVAVEAAVDVVAQVGERLPHRGVHQHERVVVGGVVGVARVDAVAPHETGARLGAGVGLVDQRFEARRVGVADRVAQVGDVELGEVNLAEVAAIACLQIAHGSESRRRRWRAPNRRRSRAAHGNSPVPVGAPNGCRVADGGRVET